MRPVMDALSSFTYSHVFFVRSDLVLPYYALRYLITSGHQIIAAYHVDFNDDPVACCLVSSKYVSEDMFDKIVDNLIVDRRVVCGVIRNGLLYYPDVQNPDTCSDLQ